MGNSAFQSCTRLSSVTILDGVTTIGADAFRNCKALTRIAIPNSVTNIEDLAFYSCQNLTYISIGNSVTTIGVWAFGYCVSLTSVTIPNSVTSIGDSAFYNCQGLTNVTIGNSVTSIGEEAFAIWVSLQGMYFQGNAPTNVGAYVFLDTNPNLIVYYLPGTIGWGATFCGFPTAPWPLPYPVILTSSPDFGLQTNGMGFTICWATNIPVVVEACTSLANDDWSPVRTNTFTNGLSSFSDPLWTNYPTRLYRLRSP
jgi:hypothetical protein